MGTATKLYVWSNLAGTRPVVPVTFFFSAKLQTLSPLLSSSLLSARLKDGALEAFLSEAAGATLPRPLPLLPLLLAGLSSACGFFAFAGSLRPLVPLILEGLFCAV